MHTHMQRYVVAHVCRWGVVVGAVLSALAPRRLSLCFSSTFCFLSSLSHMYTNHRNTAAIKSSGCVTHM